jgi:molybdenum cofactor synthesis domain-containing protein
MNNFTNQQIINSFSGTQFFNNIFFIPLAKFKFMNTQGKIISLNISEKKGVIKSPVSSVTIYKSGILNDAHAGDWHRQVSLLSSESILKFESVLGRKITYGEFAENITTEGLTLYEMKPLDILKIGKEVVLEVTQIGKECHGSGCAIFNAVGKCVMPKEGIFCRVIKPGKIIPGDSILYIPKVYKAHVITLSDRASKGIYNDRSGPEIKTLLKAFFENNNLNLEISNTLIPDDVTLLQQAVNKAVKDKNDILITTGGTGIGKRDITVETLKGILDKEIPGIMEYIRMKYGAEKPAALISRGVAGTIENTQVYTLPGSVKAVKEYMTEIQKNILHIIYMLQGIDNH